LREDFPRADLTLVPCPERLGVNAKVSKLRQLAERASHDVLVVSDADVWVPPDFLANVVAPLRDLAVGLVNPLYALTTPTTLAMRWEAVAVNADFWSGVLQSRRLAPMKFALGAAMAFRRPDLDAMGGFAALKDHLADDYELGRRIAGLGRSVELCPVVVECRESPRGWGAIWRHQVRWSRTIRVCQPGAYAASIVSNATVWPALWLVASPGAGSVGVALAAVGVRMITALDNQRRLTRSNAALAWVWLAPVKDVLAALLWLLAFLGNTVEWRGERYRVRSTGELVSLRV